MTALLCGAVMIASQAGGTSSTAGDSAAAVRSELVEAWADDFMATALRQAQVAGAIIAVVQGDRVVLTKGYGFADFERKAQVDAARTGFRIGSVAKVVTATAVMQLVEQGKLDLDRDVNEYLDFRIRSRDGSPITLRHLLTHSAGFDQVIKALGYLDPKLVVPLPEVEGLPGGERAVATLRDSGDHARWWSHQHGDRHGAVHDRPPPGRSV